VGTQERERSPGKPRLRCENDIATDLREIGSGDMDWINLTQDRDHQWALVKTARSLRLL
jgi:hypothetical protein